MSPIDRRKYVEKEDRILVHSLNIKVAFADVWIALYSG